ncbi:SPOR domain-containing protein [Deinococcus altitudinis]|uniref:SPOR domain-containing protein n=1 Tax=Deinococcus altitudinis TaxID=468914 RepID=UPI0038917C68
MNTVKRRWPDLLIGLLVVLLLVGFAALLLGKNRQDAGQGGVVQPAANGQQGTSQAQGAQVPETQNAQTPATQTPSTQAPAIQTPSTQTSATQTPTIQTPTIQTPTGQPPAASGSTGTSSTQAGAIPTIPSAPLTVPSTAASDTSTLPATTPDGATPAATTSPATTPAPAATVAPQAGGAVAASSSRVPTRNDYRISLGSYADNSAVQAATAGVNKLGYTVYPIAVASGVVAQVGPFATREAAAQALADIQRALPGALLYPPRNAPASDSGSRTGGAASAASTPNPASGTSASGTSSSTPATGSELAASGPVYLQVGAYNSVTAAQTAVGRIRGLGLEPSVNAPAGKLVTVVVGPYQGQALTDAEAKLQSGGIDSFRVR